MTTPEFSHVLPGQHVYDDVLFFGYSPPDVLDAVKGFSVRDDDVFIVTYPKAGTTWMQEILWLIMNEGDFEGAHKKPVYFRSPFLEFKDDILNEVGLELAEPMPSPRVMKTHLQPSMIPRDIAQTNCKMILVFRNPKDLCVSYYHFYKSSSSVGNFKGTWTEFLEMFKAGHVDHGSWFDFTRLWWEQRDNPNLQLVFYEDMKKNLPEVIKTLCKFLNRPLDDTTIQKIAKHCEFKSMKENPMTNHLDVYSIDSKISPLLRKGEVGDWMNYFTVAQDKEFDSFYSKTLGALDIPFTYQL
ncbi:sulfotransferase 1C4-like [Ylistrum balloti]|uniref:sulfotransferase 1C4-like n=1 Tax=Ylistrum balloti TaxID=509963 RepID=UPI002905F1D2|nr:sulfotransferase 1C4-like [Ylistrum balloti]